MRACVCARLRACLRAFVRSWTHARAAASPPPSPPHTHAHPQFAFEDGWPKVFDEVSPAGEKVTVPEVAPGTTFPKLNWLKAGIVACDKMLTVSPNYATEIASGPQARVGGGAARVWASACVSSVPRCLCVCLRAAWLCGCVGACASVCLCLCVCSGAPGGSLQRRPRLARGTPRTRLRPALPSARPSLGRARPAHALRPPPRPHPPLCHPPVMLCSWAWSLTT